MNLVDTGEVISVISSPAYVIQTLKIKQNIIRDEYSKIHRMLTERFSACFCERLEVGRPLCPIPGSPSPSLCALPNSPPRQTRSEKNDVFTRKKRTFLRVKKITFLKKKPNCQQSMLFQLFLFS